MSGKNKKQFGVWMDSHHATIVGLKDADSNGFEILEHVKNTESTGNSNENASNNKEQANLQRFFKEIASFMQNAQEVHLTGTGTAQEQFMNYLVDTPQFKNVVTTETTSNKMSDEKLVAFMTDRFN